MKRYSKLVVCIGLCLLSVAGGSFGSYLLSVLWRGDWKYREIILPLSVTVLGVIAVLMTIAFIARGRHNARGVIALTMVLIPSCGLIVSGIFFGVLDNCHLSCGTNVRFESKSPTSEWKAVWFSRDCVSAARYCPPISHVSIVKQSDSDIGSEGNAFSIAGHGGLELRWDANDRIRIEYWAGDRVLRKQSNVRSIQVVYRPIGMM